jgi:hypothetical protein
VSGSSFQLFEARIRADRPTKMRQPSPGGLRVSLPEGSGLDVQNGAAVLHPFETSLAHHLRPVCRCEVSFSAWQQRCVPESERMATTDRTVYVRYFGVCARVTKAFRVSISRRGCSHAGEVVTSDPPSLRHTPPWLTVERPFSIIDEAAVFVGFRGPKRG